MQFPERLIRLAAIVAVAIAAPVVGAEVEATIDRNDQEVMSSKAFLDAHPDLKYRTEGWFAYDAGRHAEALDHFRHAARYGDKLSQAMLAEMLWNGLGQPEDRAMAYAWADLAAERGYVRFVALRERFWTELDPEERQRAVSEGSALVATYGDVAARARMADHLRKARRTMIGKRPRKDAMVVVPGERGALRIRGWDFYAEKFWNPERYQDWVDATWQAPRKGEVAVRELEVVREPDAGAVQPLAD